MIKLINLKKSYGEIQAVREISLEVAGGEIFGFIGNNGAGKTTTIKMIVGLLKPDHGRIFINETDALKNSLDAKKFIGYAPEEPLFYEYLTGYEFLDFVADVKSLAAKARKLQIEELIDFFALGGKQHQVIKSYSHGMRKKISLAAALIAQPKVLLLDEPLTGLDPECSFKLKQRLVRLAENGISIFFSSHILETVEKICHRVGIIHEGQLIQCGTIADIRSQFSDSVSLEDIFMRLTGKAG